MITNNYAKILTELQSHLSDTLAYIELDLGQLEVYDTRPAVSFPCGLLRFAGNYEQRQLKTQLNRFTLTVKLGFDVYGNSSSLVPSLAREQALSYLETEQDVYVKLQGWMGTVLCEPLTRISDADQYSEDGLRKRLVVFRGAYVDNLEL